MILVTAEIVSNLIEVTAVLNPVSVNTGGGGTYNIYIDGALNQSGTSTDFSTETFNISM